MKNIINKTKAFLADEKGAETVEWTLIASMLVGIIVAGIWGTLQGSVLIGLTNIRTFLTTLPG